MDFRFIEQQNAVAVISCKSYIRPSDIEKKYCDDMKQYVDKIWLFAECCGPKSADSIYSKARSLGYEKFWYLFTWRRKTDDIAVNHQGWLEFVEEVRKLRSI
jgi:hypothetical protein